MNEHIKQALLSVSDKVYLYTAKGNTQPPYLIYGTDGDNSLFAGGHRAELCAMLICLPEAQGIR